MARFALECLEKEGLEPVLAYYLPYSIDPSLSVRLPGLLSGRRPRMRERTRFEKFEAHELGASLPELEQRHYKLNEHWQELIDGCRYHMAVSGSCLAARPFVEAGVPFFLWVATPWTEDREDRFRRWPWYRQLFDRCMVQPFARKEEARILRSARSLATISEYSRRHLATLAGNREIGLVPVPVDASVFVPVPSRVVAGRIGFVGRVSDPRKNVLLFVQALGAARARGASATGYLIGGELPPDAQAYLKASGLADHVTVMPSVAPETLPGLLATLDVFLVPSRQEGLCIAALEAMSAGCPVVSTPCGGPEEFVLDGETGFVSRAHEAAEVGALIARIVEDRPLRAALSQKARRLVESRYDRRGVQARLRWHLREELLSGGGGEKNPRAMRRKGAAAG
jgi:glycosyltransferase involved in cell wall biosynthesis